MPFLKIASELYFFFDPGAGFVHGNTMFCHGAITDLSFLFLPGEDNQDNRQTSEQIERQGTMRWRERQGVKNEEGREGGAKRHREIEKRRRRRRG
jgi:hypothetical protein